jgi:3-oxoacyl-[acyl-carrier-protein] synthase-3
MNPRYVIRATGSYLPERILTNHELASMVDTNDAWITERTGIRERHIVAEGQTTSDMGIIAAKRALEAAGMDTSAIDGIVVGTSTPDSTMPSVAAKIQTALGIKGPAVDVVAACTGFVYALATAQGWLQMGLCNHVLVLGAESMSRIMDWSDRSTCILFGDGAGAVILSKEQGTERGIHAIKLQADGQLAGLLGTKGGVSSTQTAGLFFMHGQEVFKHGVEKMAAITRETVAAAGKNLSDVDWLIAHQANGRMIRMIGKQLGIAEEKCVITVGHHGNTSAASIPLALDEAVRNGNVREGNLLALPALGAGLTWGCCVITM